ncbi:hypothetical protein BDN70DRAFT_525569 [Pholiota conissans]|uniref:Uncharacterized protein n=1 Tax=Pholiota conissans TaxID=109636 RepID=A0A9P5YQ26_9AGAR|nr:hypothetical protein BDN70DRAFT_525569 [Pholiota conissans]
MHTAPTSSPNHSMNSTLPRSCIPFHSSIFHVRLHLRMFVESLRPHGILSQSPFKIKTYVKDHIIRSRPSSQTIHHPSQPEPRGTYAPPSVRPATRVPLSTKISFEVERTILNSNPSRTPFGFCMTSPSSARRHRHRRFTFGARLGPSTVRTFSLSFSCSSLFHPIAPSPLYTNHPLRGPIHSAPISHPVHPCTQSNIHPLRDLFLSSTEVGLQGE